MRQTVKAFVTALCASVIAVPIALAEEPAAKAPPSPAELQRKAQNKLLAYRAARADGIRKLSERINGLAITSETTVRDFVTESDVIQTAMDAFLCGLKEVGKPRYMEDGTCEVTMQVTIEEVITSLEHMHKAYYKGRKFKIKDFQKIAVNNKTKVLRETGMGAPRSELSVEEPVAIRPGDNPGSFRYLRGAARKFWLENVTPQGRLLTVRGARVEAMRKLAERIKGLRITSETTVRDFVTESDVINVSMEDFIRGARETGITYHANEPVVEVDMQVKLRTVYATIKTWAEAHYKGPKSKLKKLEEVILKSKDTVIRETGMSVARPDLLKDSAAPGDKLIAENHKGVPMPDWVGETLRAVGRAAVDSDRPPEQGKLMALRGAELDARRKLAEQINGLRITSKTTVKDFVVKSDEIKTLMLAFQQGASVVEGSQKVLEDGTAEAAVEIELRPLWNMILRCEKKLRIKIE
jgi:hypothetical protein